MTLVVRSEIRFVEESFPECILALIDGFIKGKYRVVFYIKSYSAGRPNAA